MANLSIKQLPDKVYKQLKKAAKAQGRAIRRFSAPDSTPGLSAASAPASRFLPLLDGYFQPPAAAYGAAGTTAMGPSAAGSTRMYDQPRTR